MESMISMQIRLRKVKGNFKWQTNIQMTLI